MKNIQQWVNIPDDNALSFPLFHNQTSDTFPPLWSVNQSTNQSICLDTRDQICWTYLHGGGGLQVGEVTHLGKVTCLSI